jgi:hypothetical protein
MRNLGMVLFIGVLFCVACLISIAEAIGERDWPRDTFRFVLIFGCALSLAVFSS